MPHSFFYPFNSSLDDSQSSLRKKYRHVDVSCNPLSRQNRRDVTLTLFTVDLPIMTLAIFFRQDSCGNNAKRDMQSFMILKALERWKISGKRPPPLS